MKVKKVWFSLVFAVLAVLVMWWIRFHPFGVKVFTNPSKTHRVLAEVRGLDEVVVLIRASDWPYTFFEPRMLHAVTEGRGSVGNYYWTQDESAILCLVKTEDEQVSVHYIAAYDFRGHRILNLTTTGSEGECDVEIEKLTKGRGGVGSLVVGLPDGKDY